MERRSYLAAIPLQAWAETKSESFPLNYWMINARSETTSWPSGHIMTLHGSMDLQKPDTPATQELCSQNLREWELVKPALTAHFSLLVCLFFYNFCYLSPFSIFSSFIKLSHCPPPVSFFFPALAVLLTHCYFPLRVNVFKTFFCHSLRLFHEFPQYFLLDLTSCQPWTPLYSRVRFEAICLTATSWP